MKPLFVIPARMQASRLPGKPLADLGGRAMILRVWDHVCAADLGPVLVAAGDREILDVVEGEGGQALLTDPELPSGSDRVYAAVQAFDPQKTYDVIVNVQGDMPTLRPDDLKQVMAVLEEEDHVDIASLAAPQKDTKAYTSEHVVKVVLSVQQGAQRGRALYFTRAPVPWGGDVFYHHIGVYAYRRHILEKFCHLPPSPLEQCERLEQLRALEAGFRLDLAITDHIPEGVDSPDDLLKARKFFEISTSDHRASHFP